MMMKQLFYWMLCVVLLVGCSKDGDEEAVLRLDKHLLELSAGGENFSVNVTSNMEYSVIIPEEFRLWLSENVSVGLSEVHWFKVSENEALEGREGYVVFAGVLVSDTLYVSQLAKEGIEPDKRLFEIPARGDSISVKVKSNIEYEVTIPDEFQSWIVSVPSSRAVTTKSYHFAVSANEGSEARDGYIVFSANSLTDTVYVTQYYLDESWLEMVYVEGGTFMMGATEEQGDDVYDMEKPVHSVTLSDYYIGKFEVTQGVWKAVMGSNPSYFNKGDDYPVEQVSWDDIQTFLSKLNQLTGKTYALPTEAQWEYAARGGVKSAGYKYSGSDDIENVAWYWNSEKKESTSPVGTKQPNELGIYDMSGNVWEWCSDCYGSYSSDAQTDPTGPTDPVSGSCRVLRGGSWSNNARLLPGVASGLQQSELQVLRQRLPCCPPSLVYWRTYRLQVLS